MGNEINLEVFLDEDDYLNDIFMWDNEAKLASFFKPYRITILELERLYMKIGPLIKAYHQWSKKHESYMYGDDEKKPGYEGPVGRLEVQPDFDCQGEELKSLVKELRSLIDSPNPKTQHRLTILIAGLIEPFEK